eukprot:867920-Prymnesium_polylepis.1
MSASTGTPAAAQSSKVRSMFSRATVRRRCSARSDTPRSTWLPSIHTIRTVRGHTRGQLTYGRYGTRPLAS